MKKAQITGWALIIAVIIGLVVIFTLSTQGYPKIPEIGNIGMKVSSSLKPEPKEADLMVKNDSTDFNCSQNYVYIYNVGDKDADSVLIRTESGGAILKEITVDLPEGSKLPVTLNESAPLGSDVEVSVDPSNNISESIEDNNNTTLPC